MNMRPLHKVLITGSRSWKDRLAIGRVICDEFVNAESLEKQLLVIHGDHHSGADALAEEVCVDHGYASARVAARWDELGPAAGPIRNHWMVSMRPDVCYAFPLSSSKGTIDCIRQCEKAGIPVKVWPFEKP